VLRVSRVRARACKHPHTLQIRRGLTRAQGTGGRRGLGGRNRPQETLPGCLLAWDAPGSPPSVAVAVYVYSALALALCAESASGSALYPPQQSPDIAVHGC